MIYEIWSSGCTISIEPHLYPTKLSLLRTRDIRDLILRSRHQFSPIVRPPTKELVFIAASPTTIQWRWCVLDQEINSHGQEVNPIRNLARVFQETGRQPWIENIALNISHLMVGYWHTATCGVWSRNQEDGIIAQFGILCKRIRCIEGEGYLCKKLNDCQCQPSWQYQIDRGGHLNAKHQLLPSSIFSW